MHSRVLKSQRVTIGIPTRNRSEYLMRALSSPLAQTYADIEVVVSDNASTDETIQRVEALTDPRIVLLKQEVNVGMVGNFNVCLEAATGELFLLLSDDDILEPDAIEQLSRPFLESTNNILSNSVGVTWSPCLVLDPAGERLWATRGGP